MTVRNLDNSYADGARVGTVLHTVESGDPDFADLQSQSPQVRACRAHAELTALPAALGAS